MMVDAMLVIIGFVLMMDKEYLDTQDDRKIIGRILEIDQKYLK
jgi:hypothetical protein